MKGDRILCRNKYCSRLFFDVSDIEIERNAYDEFCDRLTGWCSSCYNRMDGFHDNNNVCCIYCGNKLKKVKSFKQRVHHNAVVFHPLCGFCHGTNTQLVEWIIKEGNRIKKKFISKHFPKGHIQRTWAYKKIYKKVLHETQKLNSSKNKYT
jgi:hypothetical protein